MENFLECNAKSIILQMNVSMLANLKEKYGDKVHIYFDLEDVSKITEEIKKY